MTEAFISRFDGWLKAELGEPTFTLMARDFRAAYMVKQWAYERQRDIAMGRKPESDMEQVKEAQRVARAMEEWYRENRSQQAAERLNFGGRIEQ